MDLPKKGIYRHFKGKRYELIDFAKHSETLEIMVVYRALYGEGGLWVRPLSMWTEVVEREGKTYTRFLPEEEYLALHSGPEDDYAGFDQMEPPPEMDAPEAWSVLSDEPSAPRTAPEDKYQLLKRIYGYDSFREGQEDVIDSILSGRDTLAILPTGAGKSLCYQLPAQLLDGVALVISPLISLMKDQVNSLTQSGIPAAYLNSSLTERQFDAAIRRMMQGQYRIVYVAPERLLTQRFLRAVNHLKISMVAVDEAHCISQWGQDFRPSYLEIHAFVEKLSVRPRLCAFTATATERVKQDIIRLLEMQDPYVRVTGFDRTNLYLSVSYTHEKDKKLMELMNSYRGFSGIVYCATRKGVETVCEKLLASGYMATRYHAGLSEAERQHNQDDFIYDRSPVMVATNAFGMGIDKSNVRFVIHYNMPKDIESYYQEAGRAGRDGERADCHLLFEPRDVVLQNFFIDKMGEEGDLDPETLRKLQETARFRLYAMADYCRSTKCLRQSILRYFGEETGGGCQYCSNCLNPRDVVDVTQPARIFAACVQEMKGRFGTRMFIDVLRGANTERIRSFRLDDSSYHGALKGVSLSNMNYIADALVQSEVLNVTSGEYTLLQPGRYLDELLEGLRTVSAYQEENSKSATSSKAAELPEDIDHELYEALRQLRLKLSRTRSVPPYAICHDSTLMDMCRQRPADLAEMKFVKGMGDRKIQSFGSSFIKVIQMHLKKNQ